MRFIGVSTLIFSALAASLASAQDVVPGAMPPAIPAHSLSNPTPSPDVVPVDTATYAVLPEGKTLPEGTFRLRLPTRFVTANYGFDADGHKHDDGVDLRAVGGGFVLEYGATDRLSLQFLAPMVYSNVVGIDADKFRQSSTYKSNYGHFIDAIGAKLQQQGICDSPASCRALIANDYELPVDTKVNLPTGESINVKANTPVRQYADSLVMNAAKPAAGRTGLGDVQVGALYGVVTDGPVRFSAGGGFRFPTGSFKDVPTAERGTGRGTTDFGIRWNLDALPAPGVVFSWQNQNEMMIAKGTRRKSSLLDGDKLNTADPSSADALGAGSDGKKNEQTYERVGARNVGFVRAAWGLGNIVSVLTPIGINVSYNYDVDGQSRLNGVASSARTVAQSVSGNLAITGLPYQIPASIDFDYDHPVAGRNQTLAPVSVGTTIKVYYQF